MLGSPWNRKFFNCFRNLLLNANGSFDRIISFSEPTLHCPFTMMYKPFGCSPSRSMYSPRLYLSIFKLLASGNNTCKSVVLNRSNSLRKAILCSNVAYKPLFITRSVRSFSKAKMNDCSMASQVYFCLLSCFTMSGVRFSDTSYCVISPNSFPS